MKINYFCTAFSMLLLVECIELHGLNLSQLEHREDTHSAADLEQKKHKAFEFNSSTAYSDLIKLKYELSVCKEILQENCSFPSSLAPLVLEYDDNRYYRYAQCLAHLLHHHSKTLPTQRNEEVVFLLQEIHCPEQPEHSENLNDSTLKKMAAKAADWSRISCSPLMYDASRIRTFDELTRILDEMTAKGYIHDAVQEEFSKELATGLPTVIDSIAGKDSSITFKDYNIFCKNRSKRIAQLINKQYIDRYKPHEIKAHKRLGLDILSFYALLNNCHSQELDNKPKALMLSELQSLGPSPSFKSIMKHIENCFKNLLDHQLEGSSEADKQAIKERLLLKIQDQRQEIETLNLSEADRKHAYDLVAQMRLILEEACGTEEANRSQ